MVIINYRTDPFLPWVLLAIVVKIGQIRANNRKPLSD